MLERPRSNDGLLALAGLSLLLVSALALLRSVARHAVDGEGQDEGEVPVRKLGIEDVANDIEHAGLDDAAADGL